MSLTRRIFASAALALPLAAQKPKTSEKVPDATPEEAVSFKTFTRQVIAPTTVVDRNNRYVNDLHTQDFRLVDRGEEQKISVESAVQPLSMVVCVQANNTVEAVLPMVKKLGLLLQNTVLGENGQAAIIAFDHRVRVMQDFTHDPEAITKALNKINPGSTTSAMIDAVMEATRLLKRRPNDHHKVILMISETRDKGSEGHTRQAMLELQFGNIVFYSVNINRLVTSLSTKAQAPRPDAIPAAARHAPPGGLQTPDAIAANTGLYNGNYIPVFVEIFRQVKSIFIDNQVEAFSKHTGGSERSFLTFKDLERAVQDIGQELQSQYMISYSPSNTDQGGYHEIAVEVNRRGLTVRTRPGYWMAAIPEHLR